MEKGERMKRKDRRGQEGNAEERERGEGGRESRRGRGLNGYIFGAGYAECSAFLRKFPRESFVASHAVLSFDYHRGNASQDKRKTSGKNPELCLSAHQGRFLISRNILISSLSRIQISRNIVYFINTELHSCKSPLCYAVT